jgi:hypothetical protein
MWSTGNHVSFLIEVFILLPFAAPWTLPSLAAAPLTPPHRHKRPCLSPSNLIRMKFSHLRLVFYIIIIIIIIIIMFLKG